MTTDTAPPRSRRGQQRFRETQLSPLEQIPVLPGGTAGKATGAWAYYIRPDGATISEALILYPNGGVPDITDLKMKEKFSINADYYQRRQEHKGFEYIGQTLTEAGVQRLVEVLGNNRADEILFCQEEMAAAHIDSDRPEVRDRERKRVEQFGRRLAYLEQPLNAEELVAELKDIARAQMLASVDPKVIQVMKAMLGEVNAKLEEKIAFFQSGRVRSEKGNGARNVRSAEGDAGSEFGA